MSDKNESTQAEGMVKNWLQRNKDAAQACVSVATILGIPLGAYLFLLTSIFGLQKEFEGVRREIDGVRSEVGAGFDKLSADIRVLIERQNNTEANVDALRREAQQDRLDRMKELRERPPTRR